MEFLRRDDRCWRLLWWGLALFCVNAGVFAAYILPHANLSSADALFHVQLSHIYGTEGIPKSFPWMYFSWLHQSWVDHHFLFHLVLLPFTWLGKLQAIKWSGVVLGGLALTACSLYLLAHRVRHVWVYALFLLLAPSVFLTRISMCRAMGLSLIWFLLAFWCMEKKKYVALAVVSCLYMWTYQVGVLLIPFAGAYFLYLRWQEGVWYPRLLLYACLGVLLGLTLNPFFPKTYDYLFWHILPYFRKSATDYALVPIGREWLAFPPSYWLLYSVPTLVFGVLIPLWAWRRRREWPAALFPLAFGFVFFLLASFRFKRFIEYAAPFGILLGARILNALLFSERTFDASDVEASLADAKASAPATTGGTVERAGAGQRRSGFAALGLPTRVVGGLLLALLLWTGVRYHRDFQRAFVVPPQHMKAPSLWLKRHAPKGAIVFHTGWADFSYLFFHNARNYYINGLNPHFFYQWKPKLYRAYRLISRGHSRAPARWIKKLFHARYVVLAMTRRDQPLLRQLLRSARVRLVFSSPGYRVFDLSGV